MLAKIVAHDRIHLLSYLARQIAHLLAHQVPSEGIGYLTGSMVALVKDRIEQLRGRGGATYHQHTLAVAGIAQPGIEVARR